MQSLFDPPSNRRQAKSAAAFRTISEVSEELAVPQHVLRFWESKFSQIRPLKRGGGRRYYRPEDVTLLRRIRQCLYEDGYTIKGVQRLLREGQLRPEDAPTAQETEAPAASTGADDARDPRRELQEIRAELERLRDLLRKAGG
ncbi:MAG TPA: MerR family transcriptional regulator [Stellaceae bacterium]|nr:MerR family transcriptional regulator [Stellaceae bacterium]